MQKKDGNMTDPDGVKIPMTLPTASAPTLVPNSVRSSDWVVTSVVDLNMLAARWRKEAAKSREMSKRWEATDRVRSDKHYQRSLDLDECAAAISDSPAETLTESEQNAGTSDSAWRAARLRLAAKLRKLDPETDEERRLLAILHGQIIAGT